MLLFCLKKERTPIQSAVSSKSTIKQTKSGDEMVEYTQTHEIKQQKTL